MALVKERPVLINDKISAFCGGCGHSIFYRVIAEVIEELGYEDKCIINLAVGCSCNIHKIWAGEKQQAPHGRPASYAVGMKRTNPELLVCTYQGDGDAYAIGASETLNAAYRGENITVFIVNNALFGMTGGQMAPTTLENMVTKTTIKGRNSKETGYPYKFPELVASQFNPAYVARGTMTSPKEINKLKKYVRNALEAQINGEGYSLVELMGACPTNWGMKPVDSLKWIEEEVLDVFPVGELKKRGN